MGEQPEKGYQGLNGGAPASCLPKADALYAEN